MAAFIPNEVDVPGQADQATLYAQDLARLIAAHAGDGVLSGMAVTAAGTDLEVDVAAGTYRAGGVEYAYAGGSVALAAANGSNPRIDLVSINTSGTLVKTDGTPAAAGTVAPPADPAMRLALARVYVDTAVTTIATGDINDQRIIIAGGSPDPLDGNAIIAQRMFIGR